MPEPLDQKLEEVFCDVLGVRPAEVRADLSCEQVESWDSVMHLSLLLAVEQTFGISIDPEEAGQLTSFGALRAAVQRKLAGRS